MLMGHGRMEDVEEEKEEGNGREVGLLEWVGRQ